MRARAPRGKRRSQRGLALMVVLLVLLALLVLCTPFLISAKNADRAASELSDRAQSRLALDSAARHASAVLYDTHSALDKTPYFDDLEELDFHAHIDPAFLDPSDPKGVMWDADVADVAGKIDLNSASPQTFANLMGLSTRFGAPIEADAKELPLASTSGFRPSGFLWTGGELIRYTALVENTLTQFQRGILGPPEGSEWRGGPRPPSPHDAGAPVLDQRAFAPALWRLESPDGELRPFAALEELPDVARFALVDVIASAGDSFDAECLRALYACGTAQGGVRAGPVWQRPARLTKPVEGGVDGKIWIDDVRWINAGSTVRIDDGSTTELALVQLVSKSGEVTLDRILSNSYREYGAEVRVLARRPVNLNTATVEVLQALFTNLQLVGKNSRITRDEAQKVAELVVQSRPFTGFEDFLRRIVLPAAGIEKLPGDAPTVPPLLQGGASFLDPQDALALYANGLNANDCTLQYSTMPYCFTTRDTYAMELRATVNAPSGVERFSVVRDEVRLVVPQRELMTLWARQEDFDETVRLDGESPWWMSAPNSITRYEGLNAAAPSRLWAHMGTVQGQPFLPGVTEVPAMNDPGNPPSPEHVFASREDEAWIQMWPSRVVESGRRRGRVMHFDHETRDPEGRYLPDETVVRAVDDVQVGWVDAPTTTPGSLAPSSSMLKPLSLSFWVKPKAFAPSTLVDIAGTSTDTDRISVTMDANDLVLTVLDAGGNHIMTPSFAERAEVRYALNGGTSPGLPQDIWSHVAIDVRGTRPDQMTMLVNGLAHGVRTMGQTRLTAAANFDASALAVESTQGFPPTCAVRVGNEVFEVAVQGQNLLKCERQLTGEYAGFGGAVAREPWDTVSTIDPSTAQSNLVQVPTNVLNGNLKTHPAGSTVQLYGYSLPLDSDAPAGQAQLANALGPFRVAVCTKVEGGHTPSGGDPIIVGQGYSPGIGLEGANSSATTLVLRSADSSVDPNSNGPPPEEYMPAFHKEGGYAAIVQHFWTWSPSTSDNRSTSGTYLAGVEVVRYSGWDGNKLFLSARGDQVQELQNLAHAPAAYTGRHAFVCQWNDTAADQGGVKWSTQLDMRMYVVPISLAVPGATKQRGYLAAQTNSSQFAQITHVSNAEDTEWVRYDWFEYTKSPAQLVRDDPAALSLLIRSLTGTIDPQTWIPPSTGPGSGGSGTGHGGSTQHMVVDASSFADASSDDGLADTELSSGSDGASGAKFASTQGTGSGSPQWDPRIGDGVNKNFVISDAAASAFQFRGVMGTYTHAHPASTFVLPVISMVDRGFDGGRPGRLDAAYLFDDQPNSLGEAVRVHRAFCVGTTSSYGIATWRQQPNVDVAESYTTGKNAYEPSLLGRVFVAMQDPIRNPLPGPVASTAGSSVTLADARVRPRLTCFPSGERPRIVGNVSIGGAVGGTKNGAIPSAVVDEIVFGDPLFGTQLKGGSAFSGGSLELSSAISETDTSLLVTGLALRTPNELYSTQYPFLMNLDEWGGLLRIGEEIVAYDQRDPGNNRVSLCPQGRGLLGTRAQPHEASEPITYLEDWPVTYLTAALDASNGRIEVGKTTLFPTEGTVLIDSELIHYTHSGPNELVMPRASTVPGRQDEKGNGIFRGRYGTTPQAHPSGSAVILMPFRYWDRFALQADGPELSYFLLHADQPAALWSSCFFAKQDGQASRIGVMQRTDPSVPWDSDPEHEPRLVLYWQGDTQGKPMPITKQSDRIEWRVFVKYDPGAFDLKTGTPYGWRESPRLTRFGAFYFGPEVVMRSLER